MRRIKFRALLADMFWGLHRCDCCHIRNFSVEYWPTKGHHWLCNGCVYGTCNFDCKGGL